MGAEVEAAAAKLTKWEVMLLENTRFYAGETKNDEKLAAGLGILADVIESLIEKCGWTLSSMDLWGEYSR